MLIGPGGASSSGEAGVLREDMGVTLGYTGVWMWGAGPGLGRGLRKKYHAEVAVSLK